MKRTVKLKESELRQMIAESVKRVLDEVSFDTAQRAYMASQDVNRPMSPAMQRRTQKNPFARAQQSNNLKQGASNSFNREYGYNLKNVPYGSGDDTNMNVADTSKPYYGGQNMYGPQSDYFQEFGGKYQGEGEPSQMYARSTKQRNYGDSNVNNGENQEMSLNNKMTNPRFYNAVRKGRNAINRTHGVK